MPREIVTVQVGQAGNQVGCRFWDLALREHAAFNPAGVYDDALSSFFRNVDTRYAGHGADIPLGDGARPISALRARAVLVDSEEGVTNQLLRGHLADLFDPSQLVTDVSGAGNNWAHGHTVYGPAHRERFLQATRRQAESCDSLQCFSLVHSLGGGTGSGLGTYLLGALHDEYPKQLRFATSIFPSADDDVITSPYNAMLATHQLSSHADAIFPVDNAALAELTDRAQARPVNAGEGVRSATIADNATGSRVGSVAAAAATAAAVAAAAAAGGAGGGGARAAAAAAAAAARPPKARAFDSMNNIVAHLLANLTASVRFEGALNVDLSDLTSSLVPFPRMQFLVPALAPLYALRDVKYRPQRLESIFSEALSPHAQLMRCDPKHSTLLACGFLLRGDVTVSDAQRNLARLRPQLKLPFWNPDGVKVGLCAAPPVGQPQALLALSNSCAMADVLGEATSRFDKLYKRKAHLHHFTQYMEAQGLAEAREAVKSVTAEYERLGSAVVPPEAAKLLERLKAPQVA
jgi:tubulin epsilon